MCYWKYRKFIWIYCNIYNFVYITLPKVSRLTSNKHKQSLLKIYRLFCKAQCLNKSLYELEEEKSYVVFGFKPESEVTLKRNNRTKTDTDPTPNESIVLFMK